MAFQYQVTNSAVCGRSNNRELSEHVERQPLYISQREAISPKMKVAYLGGHRYRFLNSGKLSRHNLSRQTQMGLPKTPKPRPEGLNRVLGPGIPMARILLVGSLHV